MPCKYLRPLALGIAVALATTITMPLSANAQDASASSEATNLQTVIVSGSRLARPDLMSPTPIVPVTPRDLKLQVSVNVADAMNDLPYVRNTVSPQMSGSNLSTGISTIDLRGLGTTRTLVLLDSRRFTLNNDMNAVPSILIKGIDVVTGGASAAWGSDAVSGVVNIRLDDRLEGVRAELGAGESTYGDDRSKRAALAWGTDFSEGRGHFVIGTEYVNSDGITPRTARERGRWQTLATGPGQFTIMPDVRLSNEAYGGLITSGVLKGQTFNPDGSMRDFRYGDYVAGTQMSGGEGPPLFGYSPLVSPVRRYSAIAQGTYDITDSLQAIAQIRTYRNWGNSTYFLDDDAGNLRISIDNAFLPSAARAAMLAAGEDSFLMGRANDDINPPRVNIDRRSNQFMAGLNGAIGDNWQWSTYVSHAEDSRHHANPGFLLADNYRLSVDSIIDPATQQPVCRISMTLPTTKCVPINLFGHGSPSEAASAYVTGQRALHSTDSLNVFSLSVNGGLFDLPAGTVYTAYGLDWRMTSSQTLVSPTDRGRLLRRTFFSPMHGAYHVTEAFGELQIPLLAEKPLFKNLAANLAARYSDYSLAGGISSWKAAFVNEFGAGLRGRVSYSKDIRAPNLTELFTGVLPGWNPGRIDPMTGQTINMESHSGGNPNLRPEKSKTFSGGLTWSPNGAAGLNVSADYFNIKIRDVITAPRDVAVLNRCMRGVASSCARVHRDGNGDLLYIDATYANLNNYQEDGVDIEIADTFPVTMFGTAGTLRLRTLGTWVHSLETGDDQATIQYVGSQGDAFNFGVPRWRAVSSADLNVGPVSANVRARYISSGYQDKMTNITNNRIGTYVYWDLGGEYRFGKTGLSAYVDVRNVFNKQMPLGAIFSPYYDVIGSYYSAGVRWQL